MYLPWLTIHPISDTSCRIKLLATILISLANNYLVTAGHARSIYTTLALHG